MLTKAYRLIWKWKWWICKYICSVILDITVRCPCTYFEVQEIAMHMKKRFRKGKALYLILILELELSRTNQKSRWENETTAGNCVPNWSGDRSQGRSGITDLDREGAQFGGHGEVTVEGGDLGAARRCGSGGSGGGGWMCSKTGWHRGGIGGAATPSYPCPSSPWDFPCAQKQTIQIVHKWSQKVGCEVVQY
jgi:hypothetical protein